MDIQYSGTHAPHQKINPTIMNNSSTLFQVGKNENSEDCDSLVLGEKSYYKQSSFQKKCRLITFTT